MVIPIIKKLELILLYQATTLTYLSNFRWHPKAFMLTTEPYRRRTHAKSKPLPYQLTSLLTLLSLSIAIGLAAKTSLNLEREVHAI